MRTPAKAPLALSRLEPQSRLLVARLDVQDYASIEEAAKAGIEKFGRIDVLVNNAGWGIQGLFEAIPREKVQEQFDVNVFGVMDCTRVLLPHFRANGGGGVIMVSSGGGFWSLPMTTMYNASKFALEGFTEALSYEAASQNVFVKSVVPHGGVSETDFVTRTMREMPRGDLDVAYAEFVKKMDENYQKMLGQGGKVVDGRVSAAAVADKVWEAATDGTDRLRYWIGNDTRGFVHARYHSTSDEEYMKIMRGFFQ